MILARFQGMAGLMQITGEKGESPMKAGERIADAITGIQAAFGIMVALYHRNETGEGQFLDLSLVDSLVAAQAPMISYYFATGKQPPKQGNGSIYSAPTRMFQTADRPINLCIVNDKQWVKLCQALGIKEALQDPRFSSNPLRAKNAGILNERVGRTLQSKPASYWIDLLNRAGLPCGLIYNYEEVFSDPQVIHNRYFSEAFLSRPRSALRMASREFMESGYPADACGANCLSFRALGKLSLKI